MQHLLIWQDNSLRAEVSPDELRQLKREGDTLIWLDIQDDPANWRNRLAGAFNLKPITLDTITEPAERAKLSEGPGYFHLVVHGLSFSTRARGDPAETPKLDIVFGPHFLVTLHRAKLPWLDALRDAVRDAGTEDNVMGRGLAQLLYTVLDYLVDSYFPVLDAIDEAIDAMENAAITNTSNDVQARIFRLKRALAHMRRVISPQVEVANALITRTGELIPREVEPYFSDVHDHLVRAFEVLDSDRDLMSGLLDVYLTTVSNRQNEVLKRLTIIATIFLPITFIASVLGQNFGHMPQVEHDAGFNFWLVLMGMGLITLLQIWYFKRRGWL
jgi:magnesium transporter